MCRVAPALLLSPHQLDGSRFALLIPIKTDSRRPGARDHAARRAVLLTEARLSRRSVAAPVNYPSIARRAGNSSLIPAFSRMQKI